MKHLLIIFSLLLTSVSWSKDVDIKDLVFREGLFYEKFSNEPFTGNCIGNGNGKIIDGKQEGEWLWYDENEKLKYKLNYKGGNIEGEQLWYHSDGKLWKKQTYKDGKLEGGEYLVYYKNGNLRKTEIFKDGKLIKTIRP